MSTRTEDNRVIKTLAYYLNKRQAVKIRDASTYVTLYVTRPSGIEYWIRGVDGGVWCYARGPGGGLMWSRLVEPQNLSILLDGDVNTTVIHDSDDIPGRIKDGPQGGADQ